MGIFSENFMRGFLSNKPPFVAVLFKWGKWGREGFMAQASTIKRTVFTSQTPKNRVEVPTAPKAATKEVSLQRIQEKAYELYLKRNGGPGSAEEDWKQAERILKGA